MSKTPDKQPTNADLIEALENCRQGGGGGTWSERCHNLRDMLDRRTVWHSDEDKELGRQIRRYLRGAGMTI